MILTAATELASPPGALLADSRRHINWAIAVHQKSHFPYAYVHERIDCVRKPSISALRHIAITCHY